MFLIRMTGSKPTILDARDLNRDVIALREKEGFREMDEDQKKEFKANIEWFDAHEKALKAFRKKNGFDKSIATEVIGGVDELKEELEKVKAEEKAEAEEKKKTAKK